MLQDIDECGVCGFSMEEHHKNTQNCKGFVMGLFEEIQ